MIRVAAALLPVVTAVFVAYLVIGLAMPVLPLHGNEGLGLGTFVVGLVAGALIVMCSAVIAVRLLKAPTLN